MLNARQEEIMRLLKEKHRISVKELSQTLFVSQMTIRRDLNGLETLGYVERYNGGAVYKDTQAYLPLDYRFKLFSKEKKQLAQRAVKYLSDDMTVFIDSSSTSSYIVPYLAKYKSIKMITNSVYSMLKASEYNIKTVFVGGEYKPSDMCTVGFKTIEFLRDINIDIGFFSSSGFLPDKGIITDWDQEQTAVRRAAIHSTKVKVFLFSKGKINKNQLYTVCSKDEIDEIIVL